VACNILHTIPDVKTYDIGESAQLSRINSISYFNLRNEK